MHACIHFVVFITVQNFLGIGAVVSILYKITGQSSRSQEEIVAKVVVATSSEGLLVALVC